MHNIDVFQSIIYGSDLKEKSFSNINDPEPDLVFQHKMSSNDWQSVHDNEMKTIMNLDSLETLEQIEEFLLGTQPVAFGVVSTKQERYDWLQKTLIK